MTLVRNCDIK